MLRATRSSVVTMALTGLYQRNNGSEMALRLVERTANECVISIDCFDSTERPTGWMKSKLLREDGNYAGVIDVVSGVGFNLGDVVELREINVDNIRLRCGSVTYDFSRTSMFLRELTIVFDQVSNFATKQALPNAKDLVHNVNHSIEEIFESAKVKLLVKEPPGPISWQLSDGETWNDNEIYQAFISRKNLWSQPWTVWLFLAGKYVDPAVEGTILRGRPNKLETRLGCSIFYDAIVRKGGNDGYLNRWKTWTVVHEVGHCLNLIHSNTDICFMRDRAFIESTFFEKFPFTFSDTALDHLHHADFLMISPGESGFRGGNSYSVSHYPDISFSLEAESRIDMCEPLLLKLTLRNISESDTSLRNFLHPKWGKTKVHVARGRKRLMVTPLVQVRGCPDLVTLKPGESFGEYFWLHSKDDLLLFTEPGPYTITAEHALDSTRVLTTDCIVSISRPKSSISKKLVEAGSDAGIGAHFELRGLGGDEFSKSLDVIQEIAADFGDTRFGAKCRLLLASKLAQKFKSFDSSKFLVSSSDESGAKNLLDTVNTGSGILGDFKRAELLRFSAIR